MQRSRVGIAAGMLALMLAAGGTAAGLGAGAAVAEPRHGGGDRGIKNVIYLVGDGMGRTHVTAARERFYGAAGNLTMETLPAQGSVSTYAVEKNSGQPLSLIHI